jgi:hypothetical protein
MYRQLQIGGIQGVESFKSPEDPMCQLAVIESRKEERIIMTCPGGRSQNTSVAQFDCPYLEAINCRGCYSVTGWNLLWRTICCNYDIDDRPRLCRKRKKSTAGMNCVGEKGVRWW